MSEVGRQKSEVRSGFQVSCRHRLGGGFYLFKLNIEGNLAELHKP